MVPGIFELQYFAQVLDIEMNFAIYNNKDCWNAAIGAIMTKWPEPAFERPPAKQPDIIDNSHFLFELHKNKYLKALYTAVGMVE